jgi:hypothetical protein
MGSVYEAKNVVTGRRVAIKILDSDASDAPGDADHLLREARAAAQLESRHVAQVLDAGLEDGRRYIVLELLRGSDLSHVLERRGQLEPELALQIVGQACTGLVQAHAAGILHRDIKPANLFVAEEEDALVVKLLDFGLAKAMTPAALADVGHRSLTSDGLLVGTPLYMSPEQARGDKTIDGRSDLWSLGVVLYEALTGATPHEDDVSFGRIILSVCSKQVRIAERAPGTPRDVAAIVDRALELDPARRFQSAGEMIDAIRAIVGSFALPPAVRALVAGRPSAAPVDSSAPTAVLAPEPSGETLTLRIAKSGATFEAVTRDGYLVVCVSGPVATTEDAAIATRFLDDALAQAGVRDLLLDSRSAAGRKDGHEGLWTWLRATDAFDRFALVVESDALMRGFNTRAAEHGVSARAFDDLASAEAWLRQPREQDAP